MHGRSATRTTLPTPSHGASPDAVAWIDHRTALVARRAPDGTAGVTEIDRAAGAPDDDPTFLARVADAIDDADRVVILGPCDMRTRLEREYVTIWHRPDRLIDVEPAGPVTSRELIERLERVP